MIYVYHFYTQNPIHGRLPPISLLHSPNLHLPPSTSHSPSTLNSSSSMSIYLLILLKNALIFSIRVLGSARRPFSILARVVFLLLSSSFFCAADLYGFRRWSSHGARQVSHRKLVVPLRLGHCPPQTRHSVDTKW